MTAGAPDDSSSTQGPATGIPRADDAGDVVDARSAQDRLKRDAAEAALAHVRSHTVIGLGSGSTAAAFIELLGRRLADGGLVGIRGVPTSRASAELARHAGVPLTHPRDVPGVDVVVDGADEVAPNLDVVKGLGGALLREKAVAQAARRRVIVVDASKLVDRLGTAAPLPVEVVPWCLPWVEARLRAMGAEPALRLAAGEPCVTDNANHILDAHFAGGIDDPGRCAAELMAVAGVVETGLFLGLVSVVLVAAPGGVRELRRDGHA